MSIDLAILKTLVHNDLSHEEHHTETAMGDYEVTHKPVDEVLGTCKAMGPCTFSLLWANVLEQCIGIDEKYEAELATVKAINELSKSGKIEVYDTGDAWISC